MEKISRSILKVLNKALDLVMGLVLVTAALYCIYCIWDNHQLYEETGDFQEAVQKLRPEEDSPSFEELLAINPDVVAWVTLEGTAIDEPILQGEDNLEYLNQNAYGEYALAGSIFLDARSDKSFQSFYQLVYGHHMEKHRMFGDLDQYLDDEFSEEHHTGTLMIPGKTYPLELVAVVKADAGSSLLFEPEKCEEEPESLVSELLKEAVFVQKELLAEAEKESEHYALLALSTCSSEKEEERIVVLWRYER